MLSTLTHRQQTDRSYLVSRKQFQTIVNEITEWKVCIQFLYIACNEFYIVGIQREVSL